MKGKAETRRYTIIKVARDEDLAEQIGKDIYFDLVDHEKVRSFRVQKQMSFNLFKEKVAKEFGIPVQFQRFWLWAKRQNDTYRPHRPLTHIEEAKSVGRLRGVSNKVHNAELKLFLEVERRLDLSPIAPPDKTEDDILLFFKLYDPQKEELRYVGRLFVKITDRPSEILTRLNEMAGYDPEEEIELYEEIRFEPSVTCEHISKELTFQASQLEDGDIVCFQKVPAMDSEEHVRRPDVPSYLKYVHSQQVVHFRSLDKPKEDDFCLEMSMLDTYDDVVVRVAQQLGLDDPSKIRLTPHNCYSQQPKLQPIKYRGVEHLSDMLVLDNQTTDILYYEVLDIPLPELQGLKTLKVAFHHATKDKVVIRTIRLPKQSNVGDLLDDLKTKVQLSHANAELRLYANAELRLLEVFYHRICKVFAPNEKIENIDDLYWTLRAEEIPEEEKNLGPHDRLIHVCHFTKDMAQDQMQIQNFGEPFFLVIHEGETLAEIKVRIQKKLQVPDSEFAKWKFALFSLGRPEYLQDSDIVSSRFQRREIYGAWEQYLGLEHTVEIVANALPLAGRASGFPQAMPDVGAEGVFPSASSTAETPTHVVPYLSSGGDAPITTLQQLWLLVSSEQLAEGDVPVLTEFLLKYPSVRIPDRAFTNKYLGFAYGCLADLLRFLQSCSVLDASGDRKEEFDRLVADVRGCAFSDHSWLGDVEGRLLPSVEDYSEGAFQKLLDSKLETSQEITDLHQKIKLLSHNMGILKDKLSSAQATLEDISQRESQLNRVRATMHAPVGF